MRRNSLGPSSPSRTTTCIQSARVTKSPVKKSPKSSSSSSPTSPKYRKRLLSGPSSLKGVPSRTPTPVQLNLSQQTQPQTNRSQFTLLVEPIVSYIEQLYLGVAPELFAEEETWKQFEVTSDQLEEVEEFLEKKKPVLWNFWQEKTRTKYNWYKHILAVGMAGPKHQYVERKTMDLVKNSMDVCTDLHDDIPSLRLVNRREVAGSWYASHTDPFILAKSYFDNKPRQREPDIGFFIKGILCPIVVLEIGDSELFDDLRFSAFEYLTRTKGGVRYVMGLKMGQEKDKDYLIRLTVWILGNVANLDGSKDTREVVVLDYEIRSQAGIVAPEETISLPMHWFVPADRPAKCPDKETYRQSLQFSSHELLKIVKDGQDHLEKVSTVKTTYKRERTPDDGPNQPRWVSGPENEPQSKKAKMFLDKMNHNEKKLCEKGESSSKQD